MSDHPDKLEYVLHDGRTVYFDLKELAGKIENLRYDKVAEFLDHLSCAFYERAVKDSDAGRWKLSKVLYSASHTFIGAKVDLLKAWEICKPHMPDDD